jgi:hypothetical protein
VLNPTQRKRLAATILFCVAMGFLLFLGGFLAGSYLWNRFGPLANNADDLASYNCGVVAGAVLAVAGTAAFLRAATRKLAAQPKP